MLDSDLFEALRHANVVATTEQTVRCRIRISVESCVHVRRLFIGHVGETCRDVRACLIKRVVDYDVVVKQRVNCWMYSPLGPLFDGSPSLSQLQNVSASSAEMNSPR